MKTLMKITSNLSFADYLAIDAINCSGLKTVLRSPMHYLYQKQHPSKPTPNMALGTLTHCLALEPTTLSRDFILAPDINRRTKEGKTQWAEFQNTAKSKTIYTAEQLDLAENMRDAILKNPVASTLLCSGKPEITLVWIDEETDLSCKCRLDWWNPDHAIPLDLKTAQDASKDAFGRACGNFNYHMQAAFYFDALTLAGWAPEHFVFIVVENTAPFGVAIYEIHEQAMHAGRVKYRQALETLAECKRTETYPAYPDEIQVLELKPWQL